MDELVRWLGAILDAEAEQARAAAEELGPDWEYDDGYVLARREGDMVVTGSQDFLEAERGRFIAAHDPARVLRDIDSKRRTLIRCEEALLSASPMLVHFATQTLREMALAFSERPGYSKAVAAE